MRFGPGRVTLLGGDALPGGSVAAVPAGEWVELLAATPAFAITDTWDGGGGDNNLSTGLNWLDNTAPAQFSSLELLPRAGEDAPLSPSPLRNANAETPAQ